MPAGGTFWEQLTDADRAAVEAAGIRRHHPMGSTLFVEGHGTVQIQSLTQQDLAEWIGVSRDAVVLALRRLRDLG